MAAPRTARAARAAAAPAATPGRLLHLGRATAPTTAASTVTGAPRVYGTTTR
ncbi:hypothetical protein AB0901_27260 [Streptomyces roseifaciens]